MDIQELVISKVNLTGKVTKDNKYKVVGTKFETLICIVGDLGSTEILPKQYFY